MKPLAFLAGSCWRGTFPDGKATDEHCYDWMLGGRYLRDAHVVRGAAQDYEGVTLIGWDPGRKAVSYWYFTNQAHLSQGTVESLPDGLAFRETVALADGATLEIRGVLTPTGADGYRVRTEQRAGEAWKERFTIEFRRTRSSAP
ncbi:MAG TPA: hypothetical protein VFM88_03235 [Vicinamibacteria bacterium]|nr:hypothetical protein [Vicinamibacteria bacterium]